MNTYNSLINNLEALELNRMRENVNKFLDITFMKKSIDRDCR